MRRRRAPSGAGAHEVHGLSGLSLRVPGERALQASAHGAAVASAYRQQRRAPARQGRGQRLVRDGRDRREGGISSSPQNYPLWDICS